MPRQIMAIENCGKSAVRTFIRMELMAIEGKSI